jgi:hypothetical protein
MLMEGGEEAEAEVAGADGDAAAGAAQPMSPAASARMLAPAGAAASAGGGADGATSDLPPAPEPAPAPPPPPAAPEEALAAAIFGALPPLSRAGRVKMRLGDRRFDFPVDGASGSGGSGAGPADARPPPPPHPPEAAAAQAAAARFAAAEAPGLFGSADDIDFVCARPPCLTEGAPSEVAVAVAVRAPLAFRILAFQDGDVAASDSGRLPLGLSHVRRARGAARAPIAPIAPPPCALLSCLSSSLQAPRLLTHTQTHTKIQTV